MKDDEKFQSDDGQEYSDSGDYAAQSDPYDNPVGGDDFGAGGYDPDVLEDIPAVAEGSAKKSVVSVLIFATILFTIMYFVFFADNEPPPVEKLPTDKEGTGKISDDVAIKSSGGSVPITGTFSGSSSAPSMDLMGAAPPPPPVIPPPDFVRSDNMGAGQDSRARGGIGNFNVGIGPGTFGGSGNSRGRGSRNPLIPDQPRPGSNAGGGGGDRVATPTLVGGGGGSGAIGPEASGDRDDENFDPADSSAARVRVTKSTALFRTILQGKMMDAVLETAINSDLPGVLRAVVSRDVYAEKGRTVLIPKGSRLIGSYNTDIQRGQARIYIIWNRVIRPDGIDIALESPSTDLIGRSGVTGTVDNKYLEIFSNSLLLSTVTVAFAALTEALTNSDDIEEGETGSGDSTTSGSVTDIATLDAVTQFNSTASDLIEDLINIDPTVIIDQGKRVKVFVNRDIEFPADIALGLRRIE